MRHLIFVFLLALVLSFPTRLHAEEATGFSEVYKTYTQDLEAYQRAHADYSLARSQYLRFNTLTAKSEAQEKTRTMLIARDQVVIAYLKSLQAKMKSTDGFPDAKSDLLDGRLNEEVEWYQAHKDRLPSAGSLEDLVEDSKEAEERHRFTDAFYYEMLAEISSGKLAGYNVRVRESANVIKSKVAVISQEEREEYKFTSEKLQRIDRWLLESENRLVRSEGKQLDIDKLLESFRSTTKLQSTQTLVRNYDAISLLLEESRQYLKESAAFLREVVTEIKTGE